ncbi:MULTISPECIES: hypothetical protein [Bacillus cereus group]|uniref:hypothetical protein n=1 Tax=Bacillus cereus group TaxID=86661 RepID=UPI001F4499E6|nr:MULTISPECIES: hypothetical protein [Bacillus cereus group]
MTGFNNFQEFLMWERATTDTIDFKKVYVDVADEDVVAGLLLSQIVYWHLPSKDTNITKLRIWKDKKLWLAKGRTDWWDEIRIGPRQFDRASKILVDQKIITKKVYKFNGDPMVHIHLHTDAFLKLLNEKIREEFERQVQKEKEKQDEENKKHQDQQQFSFQEPLLSSNPLGSSFLPNGENEITPENVENNGFNDSVKTEIPNSENAITETGISSDESVKSLTESSTKTPSQITAKSTYSSSSNIDNIINIVDDLELETDEEEEYINESSHLFYKSVVERLKDKEVFSKREQFLDVLKTLQEKNVRIGTMKQVDKSIDEFLRTVEERSQTTNPVQMPAIFYAGRLAMVIERENTVETAKTFIRQNKNDFKGNILFYNWLEQ